MSSWFGAQPRFGAKGGFQRGQGQVGWAGSEAGFAERVGVDQTEPGQHQVVA
jgi:hypothetical protein